MREESYGTIDTSVELLPDLKLAYPITNGPGWDCKSTEEIKALIDAGVPMPVLGSIKKDDTIGNPEPNCRIWPGFSINSIGLKNRGLPYYRDALSQMVEMCRQEGLGLCGSVSENTIDNFLEVTQVLVKSGVKLSEENGACPNVLGKKGMLCFDFRSLETLVTEVKKITPNFSVKLAPYSDPAQRADAASFCRDLGVPIVTLCNTFPDVVELDDDLNFTLNPKIKDIGLGGYGGPAMRPIVQAHVFQFRQILHPWQKIIAIGGAESGLDVLKYLYLGADVVEMTTGFARYGLKIFRQVYEEYVNLLLDRMESGRPLKLQLAA